MKKNMWIKCKLSDLGEVVGGATPSTKDEANYGGDISWITPKDLSVLNGRFISHGERNITEKGLKSCSAQMMPKNSVLFSSRAPIGYVAIAQNPVCTNQGFKSIVPNSKTDAMFLYYLLKYNKDAIEAMGSGTTFKEVSGTTMRNIEVCIPAEKSEQTRIASMLSAIDAKIENNDKINDNLEQQALTTVENTLDIGEPIPLAQIMSFENGFAFQSSTYQQTGKYRVITIKNVQDGYIDSTGAAFLTEIPCKMKPSCLLKPGDALLSLTGNVGRVGIVYENNLLLNQRVAKICSHKSELLPFLYFWFRMPSTKIALETIAKGTAQQNLSPVETLKMNIPFDETRVNDCTGLLSTIYTQILNNSQENLRLAAMRDALLPKLMSGEIDVSDVQI